MFEAIERHAQALAVARMFHRPHSTIKFANNGSFELDHTYFTERKEEDKMQNYRVYTGPTLVQAVAEKFRTVDTLLVTLEGTEHVYVSAPSVSDVLSGLTPMVGWSASDIREMPN